MTSHSPVHFQPYDLRTAGGSGLAAHDARPTSSPAYDLPHAQSVPPHAPPHAPQYAPDMRPRAYSSGAQVRVPVPLAAPARPIAK